MNQLNNPMPGQQIYNPVPTQTVTGGVPVPVQKPVPVQQMQPPIANMPPKKPPIDMSKAKSTFSRYSSLIIMTLALGLAFGACLLAYQEYQRIAELDSARQEKRGELERLKSYASYLQDLSNLKDQLDKNISLSEQAITIKSEIPQLLNQLILMAKQSSVDVQELNYAGSTTESTGTKKPGTILLQLTLEGDYSQISTLLSTYENARRLININSMKYTSVDDAPGSGISNIADEEKFIPNAELNKKKYSVALTVGGYYLGEIKTPTNDLTSLDQEIVGKKDNYDNVVRKLESMQWYEPTDLNLVIGSSNPFQLNAKSIQDLTAQSVGTTIIP